jgi:hypothetical protein
MINLLIHLMIWIVLLTIVLSCAVLATYAPEWICRAMGNEGRSDD